MNPSKKSQRPARTVPGGVTAMSNGLLLGMASIYGVTGSVPAMAVAGVVAVVAIAVTYYFTSADNQGEAVSANTCNHAARTDLSSADPSMGKPGQRLPA